MAKKSCPSTITIDGKDRIFSVAGASIVQHEEFLPIKKKIFSLGGLISEDNIKMNSFEKTCTHILVMKFNPTEKILGGLASGKKLQVFCTIKIVIKIK